MAYKPTRYPNVYYRGEVLYYRYRDENGGRAEVKFGRGSARDAAKAQQLAEERANLIRNRVIDPRTAAMEEHATRPVAELVEEYRAHLVGQKLDPPHIKTVVAYLRAWIAACGIVRLVDADAHALNRWLSDAGGAARTRNYRRSSVLGFTAWASDYGRIAYNPCSGRLVPKANEESDRRRLSRALSRADFDAIMAVAPPNRQAFYLLAALVGLRWRETARLTWGDVDGQQIAVPAGQTKNKERADLWLRERAVAALEAIRPEKAKPGDRIFDAEPRLRTWKHDLIRAGIVRPYCDIDTREVVEHGYRDERGRQADRKCLRMTFCTWLRDAGVDLRDAQKLMRHSDPKLTANIYTDTRLVDLQRAVERLGDIGVKPESEQTVKPAKAKTSKTRAA